jgi:hypothetical protein
MSGYLLGECLNDRAAALDDLRQGPSSCSVSARGGAGSRSARSESFNAVPDRKKSAAIGTERDR